MLHPPSQGVVIAGLSAIVLGMVVGHVLDEAAPKPRPPSGIDEAKWSRMLESTGGWWIGLLERLFFVGALWAGLGTLVAGWFAFKVASKWEAWKNVVQVPSVVNGMTDFDWFVARSQLGSYILTRLWVGTLANLVVAMAAWYLGRHSSA